MQVLNWRGRARHDEQRGQSPAGAPASSLPPAQMAVRFGRSPGARRVQHWIVLVWLVGMTLGAGLGWLLWQLPEALAVVLIVLVGLGALAATVAVGLVLATMRRASVAAGDGWVGYRVLGHWKVVRPGSDLGGVGRFGSSSTWRPPGTGGAQWEAVHPDTGEPAAKRSGDSGPPSGPIALGPGQPPGPGR